jgi:ATP-binding cassette subfamily B protein
MLQRTMSNMRRRIILSLLEVYWRALAKLRPEARRVAVICLANVALALVMIAEPILFGRVIDAISQRSPVWNELAMWAGLGAFNIVAFVLVARQADRLAHSRRVAVLSESYERVITMPLSWHQQRGTSNVLHTLLRAVDALFGLWLEFMRQHLATAVALVMLVPTALVLDMRMSLVLFLLGALYYLVGRMVMHRTKEGQKAVEKHHHQVFAHVSDSIGNIAVLQSYDRVQQESRALREYTARLIDAQFPVLDWWAVANGMHRLASTLSMLAILLIGSVLVSRGELKVGEVIAFIGFANLLIARLDQVSAFVNQIFEARVKLEEFYRLDESIDDGRDDDEARDLVAAQGNVRFENVSFRFGDSGQGVFDISFDAKAGQTIAIVGPTGAGKTTLINLLQRVHTPDQGRILIDGHDTRSITLRSLRRAIATVFQDAGLFNRSIAENIRVGRDDASHDELHRAACAAAADDFIGTKCDGYDTIVGERGGKLSGGERQRLAIARAVLKNAPILVLDEATSALDVETETRVKAAIDELRRDRTTFIIAHRLSTVKDADIVVFLDQGRMVEIGGFAELASSNGRFAGLLRAGGLLSDDEVKRAALVPITDRAA